MNAEDVMVTTDPWVSGTRSEGYGGPCKLKICISDEPSTDRAERMAEAFEGLITSMQSEAAEGGFNALVGVEIYIDPFSAEGCEMEGVGILAKLTPLFGGQS